MYYPYLDVEASTLCEGQTMLHIQKDGVELTLHGFYKGGIQGYPLLQFLQGVYSGWCVLTLV